MIGLLTSDVNVQFNSADQLPDYLLAWAVMTSSYGLLIGRKLKKCQDLWADLRLGWTWTQFVPLTISHDEDSDPLSNQLLAAVLMSISRLNFHNFR